jgi:hypothetical protein
MDYAYYIGLEASNELETIIDKQSFLINNKPKKYEMSIINLTPETWQTENINELVTALINFQIAFQKASLKKDSKNPFLKNSYVSLDNLINTTRPLLAANGLVITQELAGKSLVTTLLHSSGQFKGSLYDFNPMDASKGTNSLQEQGGGITYAKRYTWAALLGVSVDTDNDGNTPNQPTKKQAPKKKPTYPVKNYTKGAQGIFSGKCTLADIKANYTLSNAAEKTLLNMVAKLIDQEANQQTIKQ